MKILSSFGRAHGVVTGLFSAAILLAAFFAIPASPVSAVVNNTAGLPSDPVLSQMSGWGQTTNPNGSSGRNCGGYNTAGWGWISTNDTTVRSVSLPANTGSLNLKYNVVGASCDSIINSSGRITNTTLQATQHNVLRANVSGIVSSTGQTYSSSGLSVSGLTNALNVSYALAHVSNSRYTYIYSDQFTLNGFSSLSLPSGTYTVKLNVVSRPVNNFNPGGLKCVWPVQGAAGWTGSNCAEIGGEFSIRIVVPALPQDNSWCSIDILGTVQPGQQFTARFTLHNGGDIPSDSVWPTQYFKLGSTDPRDNTRFTRTRVTPNGSRSSPYGPVIDPGQTTVTNVTFTAPSSPGNHRFSWGLLKEGSAWYDYRVKCEADITLAEPPEPPKLVCEILDIDSVVQAGEVMPVTVRVTNNTAAAIGSSAKPANLAPTTITEGKAPNVVTYTNEFLKYPTPGSVPGQSASLWPGASFTFNFTVQAPSTPKNEAIFLWALHEGPEKVSLLGNTEANCLARIKIEPPKNAPYITVSGADVISGAAIGPSCLITEKATDADINTNGYYDFQQAAGKIDGYSASQYAVLSSGEIGDNLRQTTANTFLGNYGYERSELPGTGAKVKDALFANISYDQTEGDERYGNFYKPGDSGSGLPCVLFNDSSPPELFDASDFVSSQSGTRKYNGDVTLSSLTVAAGTKKTLIVSGNVTLTGPITYANSGSYGGVGTVPALTIIANNIYIQRAARVLDGSYIAYPREGGDGIVDTCSNVQWFSSDGSTSLGALPGQWPQNGTLRIDSCKDNPSFTLNGSLTGRRILWKRTNGTLGRAGQVADETCYYATASVIANNNVDTNVQRLKQCAAERIDFSAEKYLSGFTDGLNIDSVPTNTAELPPVY